MQKSYELLARATDKFMDLTDIAVETNFAEEKSLEILSVSSMAINHSLLLAIVERLDKLIEQGSE